MAILSTCHILYDEARRAVRKRVTRCGIEYTDDLPPLADDLEPDEEVGDGWEEFEAEKRMQRSFLLQYGDYIERVTSTPLFREYGDVSLYWSPNLKVFEFHGPRYKIVATEEDNPLVQGKLDKTSALDIFKYWYRNPSKTGCIMTPEIVKFIESRKGVDRSFDTYVYVDLTIGDVSAWNLIINVDNDNVQYREQDSKTHEGRKWKKLE